MCHLLAKHKCKGKSANKPSAHTAIQYCKIYAQGAINQYDTSQEKGCGFFDPGWTLDYYSEHSNWCFKTYKKGVLAVIVNEAAKCNAMLANLNRPNVCVWKRGIALVSIFKCQFVTNL